MIIDIPITIVRGEKVQGDKEYNADSGEFESTEEFVVKERKTVDYPVQVNNIKSFHTYYTGSNKEVQEVTMLCLRDGESVLSSMTSDKFGVMFYTLISEYDGTTMTKTEADWLFYLTEKYKT